MVKLTNKTIPQEVENNNRYEDMGRSSAENFNNSGIRSARDEHDERDDQRDKRNNQGDRDDHHEREGVEMEGDRGQQYNVSSGFKRDKSKSGNYYRDNHNPGNAGNHVGRSDNMNIQENLHIDSSPSKPKNLATFNPEMSKNYSQKEEYDQDYMDESEVRIRSDRPNEDYDDDDNNTYTLKKSKISKPNDGTSKKAPMNGTGFSSKANEDNSIDNTQTRKGFNYTGFSSKESDFALKDNKYNYTGFSDKNPNSYDYNDPASDIRYQSRGSISLSDNKSSSNNNGYRNNRPSLMDDRSYNEISNSNDLKSGAFGEPEETKQYIDSPDIYHKKRDERTDRTESRDIVYKNVNHPTNQNNVSNLNVNNSNINDMIKRDLQEYLSNLESQNVIKVSPKAKNKWVLEFKDGSNRDGTGRGWTTYKTNESERGNDRKSSTRKSKDPRGGSVKPQQVAPQE
jgi:hypothetical protein